MTGQTVMEILNRLRTTNKNKWFYWNGEVNGHTIQFKGYNTYQQIFRIDGIHYGLCDCDAKVNQWKQNIIKSIDSVCLK